MLQHAASSRIHLPGPPSKRLLKKRSADAAVGAGNPDCLIFNIHTSLPYTEFGEAYSLSCLYSVDGWRELISTEQNGKNHPRDWRRNCLTAWSSARPIARSKASPASEVFPSRCK